jgi:DNA-binding response OmpR family regulator
MSDENKLNILYFEDDMANAALLLDYLHSNQHKVTHFQGFPLGGMADVRDRMPTPPDIVLLDVNMPGLDGYQICQTLREDYLPESTGVIFTSGLMGDDDIMRAFSAGADDYLIKPVRLQELLVKISQVHRNRQEQASKGEQAQVAMKMAFDAMRASAELGEILQFQEKIHQLQSPQEIATASFSVLQTFDLQGTILFLHDKEPIHFRDDGVKPGLEVDSILAARNRGRMYHWKRMTFLNYQLFSVLIRNMPVDDEERYGILKDQICLLFNGLDTRLSTLMLAASEQDKQKRLKTISQVLASIALEIEQSSVAFSEQFERIIMDMETNLKAEMAQFNLLDSEEQSLMALIDNSLEAATRLFGEQLDTGKQQKQLMDKLLDKLNTV